MQISRRSFSSLSVAALLSACVGGGTVGRGGAVSEAQFPAQR
jgi:hypothetical protein